MADSNRWMTAERVEQDRGILERTVADAEAARRDPELVRLCAETVAGGDSQRIVNFAGHVRMVRSIWAQHDRDGRKAIEASRPNQVMQNDKAEAAPTQSQGFFVSSQELTDEKIGQLFKLLTRE
jgi:hypothetical protein